MAVASGTDYDLSWLEHWEFAIFYWEPNHDSFAIGRGGRLSVFVAQRL
jgi:hypothetical protein